MGISPDRMRGNRILTILLGFAVSLTMADSHVRAVDTDGARPRSPSRRTTSYSTPRRGSAPGGERSREAPTTQPKLKYQFPIGQSFAYVVNLEWKTPGKTGLTHRLSGCPYFVVNHSGEFEAVLLVIGRLRYEEIADDGTSRAIPDKDYWLGTSAIVHPREGKTSGRRGQRAPDCPVSPDYIVGEMLFPELPHFVGDEARKGGTISVTRGIIGGPGGSHLEHSRGSQTFTTRSKAMGGSRVQLLVEKKFEPDNGAAPKVNSSVATFDYRLGAVIDHTAQQTRTKDGTTYAVNFSARRIDRGEALETARNLAMEDAQSMPKKMEPIELMRTRIDLKLPNRYDADNLPAPGTIVGHYDSEYPVPRSWYAVEFVRRINRDEVVVRYLGSGETATVRPSALAKLDR